MYNAEIRLLGITSNNYRAAKKDEVQGLRNPKNRSLLIVNEDFEGEHNAEIRLFGITSNSYRAAKKDEVQGLRSPKNRSLLIVNEDFEGEHNAEIRLFSRSISYFVL
ncbi:MAG: hypothetical protein J6Q20_02415 [Alistipes sp.]|nr:hypothetical protein [Alistipes sp.]